MAAAARRAQFLTLLQACNV